MYRLLYWVATIGGLAGCVVFVVRYHLRTRGSWRKSEVGRFFMLAYLVLGSLFVLLIAGQYLGDWRRWIALTLYAVYAIFAWWPNRLLSLYGKKRAKV